MIGREPGTRALIGGELYTIALIGGEPGSQHALRHQSQLLHAQHAVVVCIEDFETN